MPDKIGQTLSLVGALIIGQAAVEAKIVSAVTVIVVAIAGVSGLMLPRMKGATVLLRFAFLTAAAFFGIYGYFFAMLTLMVLLLNMSSFGVEYVGQFLSLGVQEWKDIYVRAPFRYMKTRPAALSQDIIRKKS